MWDLQQKYTKEIYTYLIYNKLVTQQQIRQIGYSFEFENPLNETIEKAKQVLESIAVALEK